MADGKKVLKAGLGYTIGNYFLKGLNFLTIPIFSRILSTTDYGIYNTFAAYENIMFIIIGLAIHSAYKNARYKYGLVSEGSKPGKDYYSFVSATMVFLIISVCIWLLIGNIFTDLWSMVLGIDRLAINLLILFSFSNAVLLCFNTDVGLEYKYNSFLKVSGVNAIGNIVLSLILICFVFTEQRYMGRIVGSVIPIFGIAIYIIYRFLKRGVVSQVGSFLKWGITYSLPIVPHGLSQVILTQFDRIMIAKMIGDAAAGIYSFAFNIYMIISITAQSLDNVWAPWFYENMNAGNEKNIKEKSNMYMTLMLFFSAFVLLISPEMIKILGAKEYWDASYCVIPIIAGGFFSFLYTLPVGVEYYREKTKYIAAGTIGAAVINIVLNYICIPLFGYVAAAYTTLATYILYFAFHYILAWKIEGKTLFSNKVISAVSVAILAVSAFAVICIDYLWLRWGAAVVLLVIAVIYVEKKTAYVSKILNMINGGIKTWKQKN